MNGGLVVTAARCYLVQYGPDELHGPPPGARVRARHSRSTGCCDVLITGRAKTLHPDEFLGGCEPDLGATEVGRKRMTVFGGRACAREETRPLVSTFDDIAPLNQCVLQVSIHDCQDDVPLGHHQLH